VSTPRHAWPGLLTRLHRALSAVLASSVSEVPKARLHRLGDAFVGTFPADRLEFYHVLVKAGEEYLALESLCENLNDFDVAVPRETHDEIAAVGAAIGLDARYWTMLEHLVRETTPQPPGRLEPPPSGRD
jgi:hypothetical protein